MKKLIICACALAGLTTGFAQGRETVRPGDAELRRETPAPLVSANPDRPTSVQAVSWTPFAVNFCSLSLPDAAGLEIDGLRLNVSLPFATPDHGDVLGFDLGLSGESAGHVGGIAVNLFDNWSGSFAGGCIGLVNVTGDLHGLQVGLVNVADGGRGLQIGLWNQSANFKAPLVGVVW